MIPVFLQVIIYCILSYIVEAMYWCAYWDTEDLWENSGFAAWLCSPITLPILIIHRLYTDFKS